MDPDLFRVGMSQMNGDVPDRKPNISWCCFIDMSNQASTCLRIVWQAIMGADDVDWNSHQLIQHTGPKQAVAEMGQFECSWA